VRPHSSQDLFTLTTGTVAEKHANKVLFDYQSKLYHLQSYTFCKIAVNSLPVAKNYGDGAE